MPRLRLMTNAAKVLGLGSLPPGDTSRDISRVIVGLTPYLRSRLVFANRARAAQAHNRWRVGLGRVPMMLLATYLAAWVARAAGMEDVTFQTVGKLFDGHFPLLWTLAHLDMHLQWHPAARLGLEVPRRASSAQSAYIRVLRALVPRVQEGNPRTLGAVLMEYNEWRGAERVQFVKMVANQVVDRVIALGADTRSPERGVTSLRGRAEQWAISSFHESTIMGFIEQRTARRARPDSVS